MQQCLDVQPTSQRLVALIVDAREFLTMYALRSTRLGTMGTIPNLVVWIGVQAFAPLVLVEGKWEGTP